MDRAKIGSWTEFEAKLEQLGLFRMEAGIGRISTVLERLQLKRPPFVAVQVAGTNGKGSTCSFLAALAKTHGIKCAVHSSPHFISVRERVKIYEPEQLKVNGLNQAGLNCKAPSVGTFAVEGEAAPAKHFTGDLLSEAEWLAAANTVMQHGGETLTYFELVTAIAIVLMKNAGVELAIMETGLGGRFDATTALDVDCTLFAPVALDHTAVLGNTIAEIAADKAGAIHPHSVVYSAPQRPEALNILRQAAQLLHSEFHLVVPESVLPQEFYNGQVALGLAGEYQRENATLALEAFKGLLAKFPALAAGTVTDAAVTYALKCAFIPGRMQFVDPLDVSTLSPCGKGSSTQNSLHHSGLIENNPEQNTATGVTGNTVVNTGCTGASFLAGVRRLPPLILDGGHNTHGISALGHALAKRQIAPAAVIFTCLEDKEPEKMVQHLRVLATGPIFIPPLTDNPRAMEPQRIADMLGLAAYPVGSVAEAVELAVRSIYERLPEEFERKAQDCKHPLLICGSLYLLGEFYNLFPQILRG